MREPIISLSGTATTSAPMGFQSSNAAAPAGSSGTNAAAEPVGGVPVLPQFDGRTFRVIEGALFVLNPGSPPARS